jgi:hypothetical protein
LRCVSFSSHHASSFLAERNVSAQLEARRPAPQVAENNQ